jgi:hypothetical protein
VANAGDRHHVFPALSFYELRARGASGRPAQTTKTYFSRFLKRIFFQSFPMKRKRAQLSKWSRKEHHNE